MIVWNVGQTFSNTREIPARLSQASPLQLISVLQNGEWVSEESGCSGGRRAEHSLCVLFKCFADLKVASAWHLVEKCLWRERGNRNIFPKSNILEGKKKKGGRCLNNSWTHLRYLVVDWEGQFVWFDEVQMFVFGSTHQLPLRPDVPIFHHWLFLLNLFRGRT